MKTHFLPIFCLNSESPCHAHSKMVLMSKIGGEMSELHRLEAFLAAASSGFPVQLAQDLSPQPEGRP